MGNICDSSQKEIISAVTEIKNVDTKVLGRDYIIEAYGEIKNRIAVKVNLKNCITLDKIDGVEANDIYDDWIARKSIMIRDQVNPANVAASKWYSAKEIEWLVISRFGDERAKLLANKRLAEHEKSTVERLVEGWKSYGFILNQLSANARAELQGSGLHVDTDYDETD